VIPVYQPSLLGNEKKYVNECLDSTWISSRGDFIGRFEAAFSDYTGVRHATSVCNGTVAVHLALAALGIGPGDEVIVPTLTYVASVNAIAYCGATPVFVDSRRDSWQVDVDLVRSAITPRTRAIMVVHLYGLPAELDALASLAEEHSLFLVEDCAEAFGAEYAGVHVGNVGHISAFSFFGSKTVTTGEGGMVTSNDHALMERARHLKNQGQDANRRYWHDAIGFNYRMTNIAAAIGLAQMERADELMARKYAVAQAYDAALAGLPLESHRSHNPLAKHAFWMYSVLVDGEYRDDIMRRMLALGVETRPVFYPVHTMPMYRHLAEGQHFPAACAIAAGGINLPSWPDLSHTQIAHVAEALTRALLECKPPVHETGE
jgi:perosamine synthetase